MLNVKSFLAADFGAATLKVAEFEPNEAGGLRLRQYGFRALGQEGLQESTREAALQKALQELLTSGGFESKFINVCAPGFSRFLQVRQVAAGRYFEGHADHPVRGAAERAVPARRSGLGLSNPRRGSDGRTGSAARRDQVGHRGRTFPHEEAAGTEAFAGGRFAGGVGNAFRYNYGDLEGCTMLLDIGAKTSNLLFFDKENVYARGINIGANSITPDFAKESKLAYDDAEVHEDRARVRESGRRLRRAG